MSQPTLGYWNIRGLAQPIRLLLAYSGVDFEDKQYTFGPAPKLDRSEWLDVKFTLGLDFPNLPYYIDGDIKITQSQAIVQHLARKHGLYGKSVEEEAKVDTLHGVFNDFLYRDFAPVIMDMSKKPDFVKVLPDKLKSFSDYLGAKSWFVGGNISFIDFKMYEMLRTLGKFQEGCLDEFENLKAFISRFEDLPVIAKYMNSPKYIHKPIFSEMAQFTGGD